MFQFFISDTPRHITNIIFILSLRKYPVFVILILFHMRIQFITIKTREVIFILYCLVHEDFCIGIGYINKVFKAPPLSHYYPQYRDWWKIQCRFPSVIC